MSDYASIRSTVLHMLPAVLDHGDASSALVYRRAGLDPKQLYENRPIISRAQALVALNAAGRILGDEAFSLTCALAAQPERFGLIGCALLSGFTLRQCIESHARAMPTFQSGATLTLTVHGDAARLSHQLSGDPNANAFLYEGVAAFLVQTMRFLMGPRWSPTLIEFPNRAPARIDRYEDFFRAPLTFGAAGSNVIVFPSADLDRPVRPRHAGDTLDWAVFGDAKREMDAYELSDGTLVEAFENIIDALMMIGRISLPIAAETLGISVRQAQRRLSRLRLSFEDMTESRRRIRAVELLRKRDLSIADVAFATGYSDSAHFIRAFKKWYGAPPAKFRVAALNA